MAFKNYFGRKKALSKRAQALLEEINQSKSVQSIKKAGQDLSKRAQALLEEINQSQSVQSIKEATDAAANFLSIQTEDQEPPTIKVEETKPARKIKKPVKKKSKPLFIHAHGFNPALYRSLSGTNKLYLWAVEILAWGGLVIFLLMQTITAINLKNNYASYLPKIVATKKDIETMKNQLSPMTGENAKLELKLTEELNYFPDFKLAQKYSDDITRLFELSNMVIIKQNIKKSDPYVKDFDKDPPAQYSSPQAEATIFGSDSSGTLKSPSPAAPPTTPPKTIAGAVSALTTPDKSSAPMPAGASSESLQNPPAPPPPPSPPRNMNFITYDLTIRGNYLSYLKARNALTRTIPSVNIPYEDILSRQDKQNIEIRVMFEIPIRLK